MARKAHGYCDESFSIKNQTPNKKPACAGCCETLKPHHFKLPAALSRADVRCLLAFWAFNDVESDFLVFLQGFEA
jgi:hypothetical protein